MTCVILTKNPNGGIVAITEGDEGNIARWDNASDALKDAREHPLVKAWGGWVVDLDYLEISEA